MIELILGIIIGVLIFPLIMFLRARRSREWDDSNMLNMYRVIAHISTRPGDLGHMQFPDGRKPFWYINQDELSEVTKSNFKG